MARVVAFDGMERCHRWYCSLPSMASGDAIDGMDDAFDGMGRCLRWFWTMPSMVLGVAIDAMGDAIDGIEHGHQSRAAEA